ncbi:hypothetical protein Vi05172_g12816 [Venturia inaequalis]|nr:hypothetical protein Vi05172_g12816 [Venturia inaequalis]
MQTELQPIYQSKSSKPNGLLRPNRRLLHLLLVLFLLVLLSY